jgi:ADP-ribose pyrophosphatase
VQVPLGDSAKGEIEILTDPQKMAELEKKTGRKVGVVVQDRYWVWINDAVRFPNGAEGVYGRILMHPERFGAHPAAVMPILPDGRIVLVRQYRHATRFWEYELPRGCANSGESPEDAARREAKEETGMVVGELISLGEMAPDTGMAAIIASVYLAKVVANEEATPEESEAIAAVEAFSLEEIKKGLRDGHLNQIPLRDPFLTFALAKAAALGLFCL